MANTKISELTTAGTLAGSEVLPVVQSATTKKVTRDAFVTGGVQSFWLDQYNSGYSQYISGTTGTVDLSDQGGDITSEYYSIPSGWTLAGVGNSTIEVPEGFYMVQMFVMNDSAGTNNVLLEMNANQAGIDGQISEFAYAGYFIQSPYPYGSGTWFGRLHVVSSVLPTFSFGIKNNTGTSAYIYSTIRITRMGD